MASQKWLAIFLSFYGEKSEHKKNKIGYKIRILGQKVQPGIQNLFGNDRKSRGIINERIKTSI